MTSSHKRRALILESHVCAEVRTIFLSCLSQGSCQFQHPHLLIWQPYQYRNQNAGIYLRLWRSLLLDPSLDLVTTKKTDGLLWSVVRRHDRIQFCSAMDILSALSLCAFTQLTPFVTFFHPRSLQELRLLLTLCSFFHKGHKGSCRVCVLATPHSWSIPSFSSKRVLGPGICER